MPTRGYRKGISDRKVPLPCQLYFRASTQALTKINAEADERGMMVSELLREIVDAYLHNRRAELPQPKAPVSAAIRELARLGNNINQIAKQANLMNLNLLQSEARACLVAINAAVRQLVS